MTQGRALSIKEAALRTLPRVLDQIALCSRAALRSSDQETADDIQADIEAIERVRRCVEKYL